MSATHLSLSLPARKQLAWTATVALAAIAYFVAVIVAMHVLRPDLNPIGQPTSRYALGPYGWLMASAFLSMSVASMALMLGLSQAILPAARSRTGLGFLGLWAVGVLIAMIFPIDPDGAPPSLPGTIHRINGPLAFLCLTAGMILVSRRCRFDEVWRPFHRSALILSLAMLTLVMVTLLNNVSSSGFAGLAQRVSLAVVAVWFLLTATRLRSIAIGADPA